MGAFTDSIADYISTARELTEKKGRLERGIMEVVESVIVPEVLVELGSLYKIERKTLSFEDYEGNPAIGVDIGPFHKRRLRDHPEVVRVSRMLQLSESETAKLQWSQVSREEMGMLNDRLKPLYEQFEKRYGFKVDACVDIVYIG